MNNTFIMKYTEPNKVSMKNHLSLCTTLLMSAALFQSAPVVTAAELTPRDKELAINGPYYKKLVQMKDVIADILPPPAYIIEAELTVLRLIDLSEMPWKTARWTPLKPRRLRI